MAAPLAIRLEPQSAADLPALVEYQAVEFVYIPAPAHLPQLALDGVVLAPFLRPGDPAWRWAWNPGAAIGQHALRLTNAGDAAPLPHEWRVTVTPRKIDSERYLALLDDLERTGLGLARALIGGAADAERQSGIHVCSLLDTVALLFGEPFDQFDHAVRRIQARPRTGMRPAEAAIPLGQADRMTAAALRRALQGDVEPAPPDVAPELQRALTPPGGFLPREATQERGRSTFDTYEHRLLKHVLGLLRGRARRITEIAEADAQRLGVSAPDSPRAARARAAAELCKTRARRLNDLLNAPLLAEVADLTAARPVTPLFRRDPAYRRVYQMWRAISQHLALMSGAAFDLSVADLPLLYERWCALRVCEALVKAGATPRAQQLITAPATEDSLVYAIALPTDAPLLEAAYAGWTLTVRYQPRYRPVAGHASEPVSLDRHIRVPDIAIEARRDGLTPRLIVLDAKYRTDSDGRGVPSDALAEAYAYAAAIGIGGVPAVAGALLLYPGTGAAERYPGGAGAIPLMPGEAGSLEATLTAELAAIGLNPLANAKSP